MAKDTPLFEGLSIIHSDNELYSYCPIGYICSLVQNKHSAFQTTTFARTLGKTYNPFET